MPITFESGVSISAGLTISDGTGETQGQLYSTPGTFSWTAPVGVTSVCVVAVGGGAGGGLNLGAGGGGGLGWKNNISVTPGVSYTVVVGAGGLNQYQGSSGISSYPLPGGDSYFIDTSTVKGGGGSISGSSNDGGTYVGDGGGNGGNGGRGLFGSGPGGGGGAGGYSGNGGTGFRWPDANPTSGSGGGGGGGYVLGSGTGNNGGGGGVGIFGQGSNGAAGTSGSLGGGGGSGGNDGGGSGNQGGGLYGGGGGSNSGFNSGSGAGANGAVRIIWGAGRAFPSTNTGRL